MFALTAILVMIFALGVSSGPTAAQGIELECDSLIQSTSGALGYQERSGDTRCEGAYESTVSATGLELVSATIGPIIFDAEAHDHVVIEVPELGNGDSKPVDIRSVGLPLGLYFRLDARANPGSSMRWSLTPVVRPWGLKSADLGAFGVAIIDEQRVIVPLKIARPAETTGRNAVQLALRSPVDLESVWWREFKNDGAATAYQQLAETVRGGDIVRFDVPDSSAEVLHVEFAARLVNSGRDRKLRLRVYRPT